MKKRMTIPAMLVCLFFLILGSGTIEAQSFTTSIPDYVVNAAGNEKAPLVFTEGIDAILTLRTEVGTTYGGPMPDQTNANNAAFAFKRQLLILTMKHLKAGASTATAITTAHQDLVALTADLWPGLVQQSWKDDVISLLAN